MVKCVGVWGSFGGGVKKCVLGMGEVKMDVGCEEVLREVWESVLGCGG